MDGKFPYIFFAAGCFLLSFAGAQSLPGGSSPDDTALRLSLDSVGAVRQMWNDTELTAVSRGKNAVIAVINSGGKKLAEKKYDGLLRLSEEIIWEAEGSAVPVSVTRYSYREQEAFPFLSVKDEGEVKTETEFNAAGLIKSIKTAGSGGEVLSLETYEYDAENRPVAYIYAAAGRSGRTEYTYTEQEKPDTKYFTDDILVREVLYKGTGREETEHFDGGFAVRTFYENGFKVKELYERNGSVIRTRLF